MGRRQWKLLCIVLFLLLLLLTAHHSFAQHVVIGLLRSLWGFLARQREHNQTAHTLPTAFKTSYALGNDNPEVGDDHTVLLKDSTAELFLREKGSHESPQQQTKSRLKSVAKAFSGLKVDTVTNPGVRCDGDAPCPDSVARVHDESALRQQNVAFVSMPPAHVAILSKAAQVKADYRVLSLFQKSLRTDVNRSDDTTSRRTRYLVYLCDTDKRCGGWADRQRGMLSVFLLAKVTRRKFKIDMRTPCNVTNFLHPVTEDWWSWERDMTTDSRVVLDDMRGAILAHVLQAGYDVNTRFPHTVVYVRTTRDLVPVLSQHPLYRNLLPTWAGTTSQATRFRLGWNLLAAPTRSLQQRLHTAMAPRSVHARNHISNGSLVCAHLRMGHNPTMPEDWNIRNNASAVQLVFTFLEDVLEVVNHSYVFVATDDHGVRVAARERFGLRLVDSGGTIVHIDRQNSRLDACAGFESTIVDQLVLSTCRVLVISRSGFSRHAAYLRHKTDGLFILHQGAITPYNLA